MLDITPLLKLYARYRMGRLARLDAVDSQQRQLQVLLQRAAQTTFGRDHDFARLRTVEDFRSAVPLRKYEDFWDAYWEKIFPHLENCTWPGRIARFALTSGTTSGQTKYIPYTDALRQSNAKAGLDLLTYHVFNRPDSRILGGKSFMLGGSTDLQKLAKGVVAGDLSGIAAKDLPWWIKPWYFPPLEMALITDWNEKIDVLSRESLNQDIRLIAGIPSWLRIFFQKLQTQKSFETFHLAEHYPNLEMLVHGGVNFEPYRRQFETVLSGSRAELREVYPASEGFIAAADRAYGQGLRLMLDHGIFFEFVPEEELHNARPTRHWIADVEKDVNYAVVLTSCAGLWGYVLGDTLRFVELAPPRVLITGRTSYSLSAFGEHVIEEEIEDAVTRAAAAVGSSLSDFTAGAIYPDDKNPRGYHLYIVELQQGVLSEAERREFAKRIDRRLIERNEDYAAHRSKDFGMDEPEIISAEPGCFAAWMRQRGQLGGQHKVPRIINAQDLFGRLVSFVGQYKQTEAT